MINNKSNYSTYIFLRNQQQQRYFYLLASSLWSAKAQLGVLAILSVLNSIKKGKKESMQCSKLSLIGRLHTLRSRDQTCLTPWHDPGSLLVLTHQNPFPVVSLHRREPNCSRGNWSTIRTLHLWGPPPASPPPCHGKSKG